VARISFQVSFKNLDLSGLSLNTLFNGGTSSIQVQINALITNMNNFNITMGNFHLYVYYQNTLIAQTSSTDTTLSKVIFPANGVADVQPNVDVYINSALLQAVSDLASNGTASFAYTASFLVYGFIPYTYKDTFNYTK